MLLCVFFASCSGDMKDIERFARQQNPPDLEINEARVRRSEAGRLHIELDAPTIRRYSKPDAVTIYPQGVDLRFYDEDGHLRTYLHANKATTYDERHIMRASDSAMVIDYTNGDTVYLEDIVWRQDDDVIFSNHPVRAVNGNRITLGDGFSSNANMTNLRITRQRGVIEINE